MTHLRLASRIIGLALLSVVGGLGLCAPLRGSQPDLVSLHQPEFKILKQGSGRLELEIVFPDLTVDSTASGKTLQMGDLPQKPDANGYLLPVFGTVLPGKPKTLSLKILEVSTAILPVNFPLSALKQDYLNSESGPPIPKQASRQRPATSSSLVWASLHPLGDYRQIPLMSLDFQPVRYDARGKVITYLRSLKIRLESYSQTLPAARTTILPEALRGLSPSLPLPAVTNPPPAPYISNAVIGVQLKVYVSQEGLYHVSSAALANWGVNLSNVDPRTLRMTNKGEELPIYVFGEADGRFDESDYIEFWGEGLHGTFTQQNPEIYSDLYTDVNVYWLSWGGPLGARLVEESGEVVQTNEQLMYRATSYPFFIHHEQNSYYNRLSQVNPDSLKEHWYFDNGTTAGQTHNYNVFLPYPDTNALINANIRVALQGLSYPDASGQGGQHHAYCGLDDQNPAALIAGSSGASSWVGQTGVLLSAAGSQGIGSPYLHHGNNQFSLTVLMDTNSGANDAVLLNWFEITYQRLYKAEADLIRFAPPEAAVDTLVDYRIDGFISSSIDIFKLGQSKIINGEVIPYQSGGQTKYKVHFQDRPYGQPQYVALTPAAKLTPDSAQLDLGSDVYGQLSSGGPIKLLVIVHHTFENHPQLTDYLQRRNANLGRTELVFIYDVFDEYNDGIYSPQTIKDLLLSLPTPPEYLLLVGDASYDTRNLYGLGGNLIPAHYIQTTAYGAVASDFWYGLLDDDLIPDVAVGRIPCRDGEELASFLNKLEAYETNPEPGLWRNTHLFISGSGGVSNLSFLQMSQQIVSALPNYVSVERLATEPVNHPFWGGTVELIDFFNAGTLVIDYNGHGAGAVWSDNSLFRLENLPQLDNEGLYPFITNFTCFIGAFDTPQPGSILGEEFIFEPEKGGIAVLASTGLGWFINGSWLQEQLVYQLYGQPNLHLGDLINAAKVAYYAIYGQGLSEESFDTIHLMNLLGDPSMRLAFATPGPPAQIDAPPFIQPLDSVTVTLPGNYSGYEGILRIYENHDYPAFEFGQTYEEPLISLGGSLGSSFQFPTLSDTSNPTSGTYRLTFWDPSSDSTFWSAAPFYLSSAYQATVVDSFQVYPEEPIYADEAFGFRAKIINASGIDWAYLHFMITMGDTVIIVENDSLPMNPSGQPFWYQTEAALDTSTYHFHVGDWITGWLEIKDTEDSTIVEVYPTFTVYDSRPDPTWVDGSLQVGARENQAALILQVRNAGQTSVDSLAVSFYYLNSTYQSLGTDLIYNLPADSSQEAYVFLDLPPESLEFQVRMNENGWVNDQSPTEAYNAYLPVDYFTVSAQQGTGDTLTVGGAFRVYLPGGGLNQPLGVMMMRERTDLSIPATQEGLFFVLQDTSGVLEGWGFDVGLLGDASLLGDSLYLSADLTSYGSLPSPDVSLHRQSSSQPFWQLLTTNVVALTDSPYVSQRYSVKTSTLGSFTLLQNGDHQGPSVEITVEGQIFTAGGNVPTQPKISAILQDVGGVSTTPGSFILALDNLTVDSADIAMHAEGSGQVVTLSINPTFAVGQHALSVTGRDLSGNLGSATITFQVTGYFDLQFLGNYPNPFSDHTYFAYSLTEQTTELVKISIYTVSGRLIRTLYSNAAEEINYGEIYWDGRDEEGELIANGVYFYKFVARRGGQTIERTMKLAKIRAEQ